MCNLKMPFFDNKQLIHIAAESVLLVLMLFYFSLQNKKLKVGLNTCTKRVKEQEIILQTHDKVLKNHDMILRNLVQGKSVKLPTIPSSPLSSPSLSESSKTKPPTSPEKVDLPNEESPTIEVIEEELEKELNELKVDEKKSDKDESLEEQK